MAVRFGDISPSDLQAAIRVVAVILDACISALICDWGGHPALVDKLNALKADMARRLNGDLVEAPWGRIHSTYLRR